MSDTEQTPALWPGALEEARSLIGVELRRHDHQWTYDGTRWEWYRPIRHRDRFTTKVKLLDAVEKRGGKARAFIVQTGESLFTNDRGELVARALGRTARSGRRRARSSRRSGCRRSTSRHW